MAPYQYKNSTNWNQWAIKKGVGQKLGRNGEVDLGGITRRKWHEHDQKIIICTYETLKIKDILKEIRCGVESYRLRTALKNQNPQFLICTFEGVHDV